MRRFFSFFVVFLLLFGCFGEVLGQVGVGGEVGVVGFQNNALDTLKSGYKDGVFSFGEFLSVESYFVVGGVEKNVSAVLSDFSKTSVTTRISSVLVANKSVVHYGLDVSGLSKVSADSVGAVGFRIVSKEKVEYESFIDEQSGFNVSRYIIRSLNLELRFDDLQKAGFSVDAKMDGVVVGNVTGKTSMLLDPVVYSGNTITVTGYTSGTPCNFGDL